MWRVLPNAPNRAPSKTIKALFIWLDRHNAVTRFMGYFHGQLGRGRERGQRPCVGLVCVCVLPGDMRLLALRWVIHAFINIVVSGTTCDGAILISVRTNSSTAAKQTRPHSHKGRHKSGRINICKRMTNVSWNGQQGIYLQRVRRNHKVWREFYFLPNYFLISFLPSFTEPTAGVAQYGIKWQISRDNKNSHPEFQTLKTLSKD